MLDKKQFSWYLGGYFLLRVFAYFFSPDTPLQVASVANQIVTGIILLSTLYLITKKDWRGWVIVAAEIILGGGGGYLALFSIALRTWLLAGSLLLYFIQTIQNKLTRQENVYFARQFAGPMIVLLFMAGVASLNGIANGHALGLVFSDTLPYLFLLYIFPLLNFWTQPKFRAALFQLAVAAIVGNVSWILFTLIGFSTSRFYLDGNFYHFFRDVAGGKITGLDFNFYRIVLNEHLLLAPLLIYFIGRQTSPSVQKTLAKKTQTTEPRSKLFIWLAGTLLIILATSLTRAYMLGIFIGLVFLLRRNNWKQVLIYSVGAVIIFMAIFSSIHLTTSRGKSFGWELLGMRAGAVINPQTDDSGLSRLLLLPKIWEKIKSAPLFGTGLGDTLTVYSPTWGRQITTSQFDWGYFEIIAEMGIVGALAWLIFLLYIIIDIYQNKSGDNRRIFLATFITIAIVGIAGPMFTHIFGIVWLLILMSPLGWLRSSSTGGIVVNSDGKIAVVANHNSQTWSFPKGNIEPGEEKMTATKREIYEETGLAVEKLKIEKLLGEYERLTFIPPHNFFIHKEMSLFLIHADGILCPIDPHNPEARWVKKEEVANLLTHPKDKEFFLQIYDQI